MKKIAFYLCTIVFLCFFGCSNNDDGPETPGNPEPPGNSGNPVQLFPANFQPTGSSANDILSNTNFERLLIEIAFVEGFAPENSAVSGFINYLREFTFKQFIELRFTELPSPNDANDELTLEEISDLEIQNRTAYNDGETLAIYIYFADAPSEGDDLDEGLVTLGAVYRNTSMVIYESTLRNLADNSPIPLVELETATLEHEFGHLFGLVNLGTVPVNDHEDPEAENHCVIDPCLMRAQLEFQIPGVSRFLKEHSHGMVSSCNLNGMALVRQMEANMASGAAIVPELDDECRLDLASNGGRPVLDN